METFYNTLENSLILHNVPKNTYLTDIEKLYPQTYTDDQVLEHIRLLKEKKPTVKFPDFEEWLLETYNLAPTDLSEEGFFADYEFYANAHSNQNPTRHITKRDIKISNILKARVCGMSITISPKANHFKSYNELLAKTALLTNCKYITDAQGWQDPFNSLRQNDKAHRINVV